MKIEDENLDKVYTILGEEEEELSEISWDDLTLFISPDGKPTYNSKVLWVSGFGGVAQWMNLGDAQIVLSDVEFYMPTKNLPVAAKKEFIKACFNETGE